MKASKTWRYTSNLRQAAASGFRWPGTKFASTAISAAHILCASVSCNCSSNLGLLTLFLGNTCRGQREGTCLYTPFDTQAVAIATGALVSGVFNYLQKAGLQFGATQLVVRVTGLLPVCQDTDTGREAALTVVRHNCRRLSGPALQALASPAATGLSCNDQSLELCPGDLEISMLMAACMMSCELTRLQLATGGGRSEPSTPNKLAGGILHFQQ